MTLETIVVAVAAFAIGFSKAGIGGGLGPLITALMLLSFPPQTALAVLLPLLMVGDVFSVTALWNRWSMRELVLLLPGATIGVAVGTYVVSSVSAEGLRLTLGVVVLAFVVYFLIRPRLPVHELAISARWPGWLAGTSAGVISALAHSGGPPISMYLLLKRVDPVRFVATTVLVFAAINLIKVPAYAAAGLFDWQLQARLWWAALIIPAGVALGRAMVNRIHKDRFQRVIVALLAVAGIFLLFD